MDTDNISLNRLNLSFFSVLHTLMDRYFFSQAALAAPGELRIKSQRRTLIIMSSSVALGIGPSCHRGLKATLLDSQQTCRCKHLRNHQPQTASLKSRGMRAIPTGTFSLSKKAVKMRQPRQIGHNQGFCCMVTKSVYVEPLFSPNTHFHLKQIPRRTNINGKIQEH